MFIKSIRQKYLVIARDMAKDIHKDFQKLMEIEKEEFTHADSHLPLEKRKELIDAKMKKLIAQKDKLVKDIQANTEVSDQEKEQDLTRLNGHITHYRKGLLSMENAIKWRDKPVVKDADWEMEPQGEKLKSSKPGGITSFSLPSGHTCPMAGECKNHCFALSGQTEYNPVCRDSYSKALGLAERDDFVKKMNEQIKAKYRKSTFPDPKNPFRIHGWGDFYSNKYAKKWAEIIKSNPNVWFYAYTKSHNMPQVRKWIKTISDGKVPNLKIIQSVNGRADKKIDPSEPIAVVFKSKNDMNAWNRGETKGPTLTKLSNQLSKLGIFVKDGTFKECKKSDLVAADPSVKRIGIVEHGILHQPKTYKIDEVEDGMRKITASVMEPIHCEQLSGFKK